MAIHHLTNDEKRNLYERIFHAPAPGGVFVNAEQVLGETEWGESYTTRCAWTARAPGSDEEEICGARERMSYDKSATLKVGNW